MKKRLLSVMLCLCMLLAYTPAQTWAVSIVPNGYTAVYTLEDIYKTADRDTPVKMILMNDIDTEGKLIKTGFVTGGGDTYYYENNVLALGFTKIGTDYYFFNAGSGKMYKDTTLWVGSNSYGVTGGMYHFDTDGKMV